jgi:hypothetical protein
MTKNFNNWNNLKQKLHNSKQTLHIKQGEIYFISIGQNIGYETYGKGEKFLRPVLVYKKLSRYSFIGIPLTSKYKEGTYFFNFEYKKEKTSTAILSQMRSFDTKRISYYSGNIKKEDFEKLKYKVQEFMDITPKKGGGITSQDVKQRNNESIVSNNTQKVKIIIPNNNIEERKYILDIIFDEFLGLDFEVVEDECKDWIIELESKKSLTIKDTFFSKYPKDLEYLKLENIPSKIEELDIFAASFFMLTRWEEYVNKNRDLYNRFPATESLAFKQSFLDRPVVNEYIEELKSKLLELDNTLEFKKREYQLFLTHDIDHIYQWKSWKQVLKVALGDIVKRKSLALALERVVEYYLIKRKKIKDPFDTFDWLMDKSEAIGVKSRFYFMSGGVTSFDNNYKIDEPKSLELIKKIKNRGHIIGIHPSYNAYNDFEQFKKEKELLEKVSEQKIVEGREHYLRFEVPHTWQVWEDNGMKVDSTCGYADKEGFRCGTGDEFSVFNILTRKKLKLKERSLIYMDDNHHSYNQNISQNDSFNLISKLIDNTKKYNSSATLLFHNSIFTNGKNIDFRKLYNQVMELK